MLKPKWIVAIVFWILLLLSFRLSEEYPAVKYVWSAALLLFILATVINFAIQLMRHSGDVRTRPIWERGYPRWFTRFAYDEDEQAKNRKVDER